MNYPKIYHDLMMRAKTRQLDIYTERHHIIPKCIGGDDSVENLVHLTPEEHFLAHQLLVKIYPYEKKLVYAAHMMGNTRETNKSYGWIRRKVSSLRKGKKRAPLTDEQRAHLSALKKGVPRSAETRRRISKRKVGQTHTQETKNQIAEKIKGRIYTVEHRAKISASLRGRNT